MSELRLIRGHMDGDHHDVQEDYYALPREESLAAARELLERLYAGATGSVAYPDVPPDRCDVDSRFA